MKLPNIVAISAAFAIALTANAAMAEAARCSLDRVTFVDAKSGGTFVATKVATKYEYLCEAGTKTILNQPSKTVPDCHGPFGDTIIEGMLNGKKAFAVYTVNDSAPCCVWYSYSGTSTAPQTHVAGWLAHQDVPTIALGDDWYEIGPPNPPYDPDKGPMGGGDYLPKVCRTE